MNNYRRFILFFGYYLLLSSLTFPSFTFADKPESLPGWDNSVELPGAEIFYSSPVIADIDNDPTNGLEIAIAGQDAMLHVVRSDGSILWSKPLPMHKCKKYSSSNKLYSSPAVGDLFGKGINYIVVGYGGIGTRGCGGGVTAYRGIDGKKRWKFNLKRFSKKKKFWTQSNTVFSTISISDTNNNGKLEIGFGSYDRNVYLLNARGKPIWYYNAADTVWSSGAFADINNDGQQELIIGTDISRNDALSPPTKNGGYVYAFKTDRRKNKHIGFRDESAYIWQTHLDQVVYSSPVVADVLKKSPGNEVIVGSGCFFPDDSKNKEGRWIKILKASTGKVVQTLKAPACMSSSVAVGDIDNDGQLEIVATVNGDKSVGGDGMGRLIAWDPEFAEPKWEAVPRTRGKNNDEWLGFFQSPLIADLNGDGNLEVIVSNASSVEIFRGVDGKPLTCQGGNCAGQAVLTMTGTTRSTPAIGDINLDRLPDIFVGSSGSHSSGKAKLYGWTNFLELLPTDPGMHEAFDAPWPQHRGNAQRDGVY